MLRLQTTPRGVWIVGAVLLFLVPRIGAAQACMGVPLGKGQVALDGGVAIHLNPSPFAGGPVEFIDLGANILGMRGPVTAGAAYTFSNLSFIHETGHGVRGHLGFELRLLGLSVCPHVGGGYLWASQNNSVNKTSLTQTWVPVGIGIGHTFMSGLTLFAIPQYWYLRETEWFERDFAPNCAGAPVDIELQRESSCTGIGTGFDIITGVRYGTGRLFGGASISVNLVDVFIDRQIGLGATIGYIFGTKR